MFSHYQNSIFYHLLIQSQKDCEAQRDEKHNNYEANYDIRYTSEYSPFNLVGESLLTEVTYDIRPESEYVSFDNTSLPLFNNAISGRKSKKYFRIKTKKEEDF